MRRREFIAGLGSAAASSLAARAQQRVVPVIGYLSPQSAGDDYENFTGPFLQGLKETGYVEGQNVAAEYRYAGNQLDKLPALAADLVHRRVAIIVAAGSIAARAAKAATETILRLFELWLYSDPRRALCLRAALAAPTYIRPGLTRSIIPHAHCEGVGSKGDGTFLLRGVFQP